MKQYEKCFFHVLLFFCGSVATLGFTFNYWLRDYLWFISTITTVLLTATATLIAAYLGPKKAFQLENERRHKEEIQKQILQGNTSIFYLSEWYNNIYGYKMSVLVPMMDRMGLIKQIRTKLNAEEIHYLSFLLQPHQELKFMKMDLDISNLTFLLISTKPDILQEISLSYKRYVGLISNLNDRSNQAQHVRELLVSKGFKEGDPVDPVYITSIIGQQKLAVLTTTTKDILEDVDSSLELILKTSKNLKKSLNNLFPRTTILDFDPTK